MAWRRRTFVLAIAATLVGGVTLTVGAIAGLTQTDAGRALLMRALVPTLNTLIPGRLYIGRIGGTLFTELTIDSLDIRDPQGRPFVQTGPLRVTYDPRDLLDRRIVLKSLEVQRPYVTLVDYGHDEWNWMRALRRGTPSARRPRGRWGEYIRIDTSTIHEATVELHQPWAPPDSLRGARADSAVRATLRRLDYELRRDPDGRLVHISRFLRANIALGSTRLTDPDSVGQRYAIRQLDVVWMLPPFWFRNLQGQLRIVGDTLWVDHARFNLARSAARGTAHVVWGGAQPVRYDIRLQGDTLALSDLAWIHPAIPASGGGRTAFTMRNNPRDLSIMEYGVQALDVTTLRSRLTGRMTFGVGGPVLRLTDMDLALQPAHTDLLRHFNGGPFPYDWQGTLRGRIVARGGPVTDFDVDEATLTYDDAHVAGARSGGTFRGRLNVERPSKAVLHAGQLRLASLDLRTPQFVNPSFPALRGVLRGAMRLDSLWDDGRFSALDLEHVDGPGTPSRFTGSGRYTLASTGVHFDVDLQAAPFSYTTFSRSYPDFPLRGTAVGPIRAAGVAEDFDLQFGLAGAGGELSFQGRAMVRDALLGGTGPFTVRGGDLQALFGTTQLPASSLALTGDVALTGQSFTTLRGTLRTTVRDGSTLADARVYGGTLHALFDGGQVRVDSLALESSALRLAARGGLGLLAGRADNLTFTATLDSLGGLRPWLTQADQAAPDTLRGVVDVRGRLSGTIDTLDPVGLALQLRLDANDVAFAAAAAARASLTLQADDIRRGGTGQLAVTVDSARLLGVRVAAAAGQSSLQHGLAEQFHLALETPTAARVAIAGGVARRADTTTLHLDTLTIRVDSGLARPRGFALQGPAEVQFRGATAGSLDSLVLVHTDTGRIALAGRVDPTGVVEGRLALDQVSLADVGQLLQVPAMHGGTASATLLVTGTRELPRATGTLALREATIGRVRLGVLDVEGQYDTRRLGVNGALLVDGRPALVASASLPLDLALVSGRPRQQPEALTGSLRSDRPDLRLLEALFPDLTQTSGRLATTLTLSGTWDQPRLRGQVRLDSASVAVAPLGIRLAGLSADIGLDRDTVYVRRFGATSGARGDTLGVSGTISLTNAREPTFDLRLAAHTFQAVDKARTAALTLTTTTPLTLTGTRTAPRVRGAVRIDRGRVYISALAQRRGLDLSERADPRDSVGPALNALLPSAPNALMQNLRLDDVRVSIGDDVWLRSPEANLKLGGTLRVTRAQSRDGAVARLALADTLVVERGTYQLNLGIARPGFTVERGVVRFFGDPELQPALDITALHTVRELRANSNRQEVRIRVGIGGTLDRPTLALTSADNPPLPESDMLSYLVTGEPAYALLGTAYADQGATLALRLAGSYLSSRLAGGRFDVVQVEPTALNPGEAANLRQNALGILASTRVGVGGQVARNTFLTFSTGLCGLAPQASGGGDALSLFAQGLGVKVERRFDAGYSVALGLEPASSAQSCGRLGISRTFQQTPSQIGLDFFRIWTF